MSSLSANVVGAGILGLWQAYQLAKDGVKVRVFDHSKHAFANASSWIAGAMLAPFCEAEASEQHLIPHAIQSLEIWQKSPFEITQRGTLIVAPARDKAELKGFAKRTLGHEPLREDQLEALEPDLSGRFSEALFYPQEAHLAPRPILQDLIKQTKALGGTFYFGFEDSLPEADFEIDCRGMGAQGDIEGLRPVRGEMAVVKLEELTLTRPIRLLHPRMPCYIVPWPDHHYMVGATVVETDDEGPVSVRAALELLGAAFTVHPGFGEAKIIELQAGARPSYADNLPKIQLFNKKITVNGAYRHGFLLAPLLATQVSSYIREGIKEGAFFA